MNLPPPSKSGAVQMEYLLLAVLLAAAAVIAIILFSRAVTGGILTAADATSLDHSKAQQEYLMRRQDRADDTQEAKQYHEQMHK